MHSTCSTWEMYEGYFTGKVTKKKQKKDGARVRVK